MASNIAYYGVNRFLQMGGVSRIDVTGSPAREAEEAAGTYEINQGSLSARNFTLTMDNGLLTISPEAQTVTPDRVRSSSVATVLCALQNSGSADQPLSQDVMDLIERFDDEGETLIEQMEAAIPSSRGSTVEEKSVTQKGDKKGMADVDGNRVLVTQGEESAMMLEVAETGSLPTIEIRCRDGGVSAPEGATPPPIKGCDAI